MEYALEGQEERTYRDHHCVLILVLMEYALEGSNHEYIRHCRCSLNPCSNGICSRRKTPFAYTRLSNRRLNPCSNGICSRSKPKIIMKQNSNVLILVLMEYALEGMHL